MNKKPRIFVITPFDEEFLDLYNALKEQFAESFEFANAGDLDNQQNILKDIVVEIHLADVIIADLTGLNPNVFYELGLAHAMNKKVIIITQDITELPFDIRSYRANQYSLQFNKIIHLYSKLEELLAGAISGDVQFGNPVSDYVKDTQIPSMQGAISVVRDTENSVIEESEDNDEDKGFLDFISDIEESTIIMTSEINAMRDNMNKMTSEIKNGTREINRVNTTGGSSTATFVRNISRKLSQPVNIFASQLKGHTFIISDNWGKIENSYLALLDDGGIHKYDNFEGMRESVDSLGTTQAVIYETDRKIKDFIKSLNTCTGMERRLTKAITTLISELQNYLSMTDMMASSIDRIISKGEIFFGEDKPEV